MWDGKILKFKFKKTVGTYQLNCNLNIFIIRALVKWSEVDSVNPRTHELISITNRELWLIERSNLTWNIQLESFISAQYSYATLKWITLIGWKKSRD